MEPDEATKQFWAELIARIHAYQSRLDPPRSFLQIAARRPRRPKPEAKPPRRAKRRPSG